MRCKLLPVILAGYLLSSALSVFADAPSATPTIEQLWEIIQAQQAEIESLKKQQQDTAQQASDADEKAEAAVVAVEEVDAKTAGVASWVDKTTIGGYGELHYNNFEGEDNELDLHRFVLFFGHEFTDSIRFFSEFELNTELQVTTRTVKSRLSRPISSSICVRTCRQRAVYFLCQSAS